MLRADERRDIVGELHMRGLHNLVEKILAHTDARTVAACHQVQKLSTKKSGQGGELIHICKKKSMSCVRCGQQILLNVQL